MHHQLQQSILAIIGIILICQLVQKSKYRKPVFTLVSVLYLGAVFYYTMIRGRHGGLSGIKIRAPLPFYRALKKGRFGSVAERSMLNLLLFVPYGYLVCYYYDLKDLLKRINPWRILAIGFTGSLLIETSQLVFKRGVFELDDLVKNTMGAAAGWLIFISINRLGSR